MDDREYSKEKLLNSGLFVHWDGNYAWVRVANTNLLFLFKYSYGRRWYVAEDSKWISPSDYKEDFKNTFRGVSTGYIHEHDLKKILLGIPCNTIRNSIMKFFEEYNDDED